MEKIRIELRPAQFFCSPILVEEKWKSLLRSILLAVNMLKSASGRVFGALFSMPRTGFRGSDFLTSRFMLPGASRSAIAASAAPEPPPSRRPKGGITFLRGVSPGNGWQLSKFHIHHADHEMIRIMEYFMKLFGFGVVHCRDRESAEKSIAHLKASGRECLCYCAIPDQDAGTRVVLDHGVGKQDWLQVDFPAPWYMVIYKSNRIGLV